MNVRAFALFLTVIALAVLVLVTTIPTGTAGLVRTPSTNETIGGVVVSSKVAKQLPPGSIDGTANPELIPDEVAYSLLFRLLSQRDTKEDEVKIRAYIKQMNLTDAKGLLAVVDEFERRVGKLDRKAQKIHEQHGANLDSQALAELNDLEKQKKEIIAEIVEKLPERIDVNSLDSIRIHVKERVKRNVKMIPEHVHQ